MEIGSINKMTWEGHPVFLALQMVSWPLDEGFMALIREILKCSTLKLWVDISERYRKYEIKKLMVLIC